MFSSCEERRTSGAHLASERDSISRRGTEPHSRTSSLRGEEEAVAVAMIGYYLVVVLVVVVLLKGVGRKGGGGMYE